MVVTTRATLSYTSDQAIVLSIREDKGMLEKTCLRVGPHVLTT